MSSVFNYPLILFTLHVILQNVYESALTTDDAEEVEGVDMVKSKDQSEPELHNGKGATNGHAMHVEMVESKEHFMVDTDAARKRLKKLGKMRVRTS